MITSNEILIEQAGQGNEKSFRELVERFIGKATRYAKGILTGDIDDAVQDTFIKIWQNAPKFDAKKASFQTWFYTVLHRTCLDYTRKIKHTIELDETIQGTDNIVDHLLNKERYHQLKHKIHQLGDIKQRVIILRYWEQHTNKQIADIIGKTEKNIEVTLVRARQDLRKMLEKEQVKVNKC